MIRYRVNLIVPRPTQILQSILSHSSAVRVKESKSAGDYRSARALAASLVVAEGLAGVLLGLETQLLQVDFGSHVLE